MYRYRYLVLYDSNSKIIAYLLPLRKFYHIPFRDFPFTYDLHLGNRLLQVPLQKRSLKIRPGPTTCRGRTPRNPLFIYAILLAANDSHIGDIYIIEGFSRASSLVEAMFQSLPQIGKQFYNNQFNSNWSALKYFSICVSGLGIVYTCYKLCHALDKIFIDGYKFGLYKNAYNLLEYLSEI